MDEILQHFTSFLTFFLSFLRLYSDMIRLLEAIFRLNKKECIYTLFYVQPEDGI